MFDLFNTHSQKYYYIAFFRVVLCILILYKLLIWGQFYSILFGNESFIIRGEDFILNMFNLNLNNITFYYKYILFLTLIFTFLSIFGIFKNISIFFLFLFIELIQRINPLILNGGDNFLKFLLLYLSFANSFQFFVIKKNEISYYNNLLTNLAITSIILHLCLIYFISGLHKLHSKVWFSGVGVYYCFALERFCGTPYNKILIQNGIFVTFSTYLVLFWELFFPFLIGYNKIKNIVLSVGILMHSGIFIFMMIYDFQIIFILCYGFFYTDAERSKLKYYFRSLFDFKNKKQIIINIK